MRKKWPLLFCLFMACSGLGFAVTNISLDEIRKDYPKAMDNKLLCEQWYAKFQQNDCVSSPTLLAYKGGICMGMAKFSIVAKKTGYVLQGKKCIEAAVLKDKNNVEIRFIRYSVQVKLPPALAYNKNINEDKLFIQQNISQIKNENFKNEILKYLKENTKP